MRPHPPIIQFGDRHRRVCIIELDGDLFRKRAPIGVSLPETAYEIGQRASDEKILLHKAQALPHACVVVGIQYPRQRFGLERLGQRPDEIAAAEFLKIEVIVRRCGPEPERIDSLAAVAHHGTIEWNADKS